MSKSYSELVKQAESAVSSVKDPELRRAAFEKILDDLLSDGSRSGNGGRGRSKKQTAAKQAAAPHAKSKGRGPQGYIREMIEDGFFGKQRTMSEVRAELGNRGHHIPLTSLSGPLQKLVQQKALRRQKAGDNGGKKKTFVYSNW